MVVRFKFDSFAVRLNARIGTGTAVGVGVQLSVVVLTVNYRITTRCCWQIVRIAQTVQILGQLAIERLLIELVVVVGGGGRLSVWKQIGRVVRMGRERRGRRVT